MAVAVPARDEAVARCVPAAADDHLYLILGVRPLGPARYLNLDRE